MAKAIPGPCRRSHNVQPNAAVMLIAPTMNNGCSRPVAVQSWGGNSPDGYGETWVNVCMLALTDWLAKRADLMQGENQNWG